MSWYKIHRRNAKITLNKKKLRHFQCHILIDILDFGMNWYKIHRQNAKIKKKSRMLRQF